MDARSGGKWLKSLRLERNWTQQQAVDKVNQMAGYELIDQQTLSQYELGRTRSPLFETLVVYAKVYDKTPSQVAEAYGVPYAGRECLLCGSEEQLGTDERGLMLCQSCAEFQGQ
jgi:transcriptional regulator with XRE-family HTH domain